MPIVNGKSIGAAGGIGTPPRVEITLVGLDGTVRPGWAAATDQQVTLTASIQPAPDGSWSVTLLGNADIYSPFGDTVYRVSEGFNDALNTPHVYYIGVPATGGPYWVGDIRTNLVPGQPIEEINGVISVQGRTGVIDLTDIFAELSDLTPLAVDSTVVHKTGTETIAGVKTFSSAPVVPTGAFTTAAISNLPMAVVTDPQYGAVGDGVADDTAAIASAIASGRTVVVPPGKTFKVSQIAASSRSDLTLVGYGASIVGTNNDGAIVYITGGSRISVLGLRIAHAAAAVRTNGGFGLFVESSSDVNIRDCTISATASAGIYVDSVTRATIQACSITSTLADGIHITDTSTQITVAGNRTSTTGDDGIAVVSYQSDTGSCQDITITGNSVFQSKSRGISVVGGANVTISGNTIRSTKYGGVYIAYESSFSTRGVSSVTVAGNTIEAANTYDTPSFTMGSIMLSASSGAFPVQKITIVGNTVVGGGHRMVDVDGNAGNPILDLAIVGNHLIGANTAGAGIEVARATGVRIAGNSIAKSYGSGVYINSSCAQVHVTDNMIHYPNQGNAGDAYGVYNNSPTGRTWWNSVHQDPGKTALLSEGSAADQSGVSQALGSISANQIVGGAGGRTFVASATAGGLAMANDGQVKWTADTNAGGGTIDTGLARDSAGVLKTTNGSSGNGALKVTGNVGFYNASPAAKPTVTGSRGGNAALASLLTALAGLGLLTDSTTA